MERFIKIIDLLKGDVFIMSVWDKDNDEYIIEYWGNSIIDWQQKNREILNESIRVYNNYVRNLASLQEVKKAIYYAEDRLKNESGSYLEEIDNMKENVDEIESKKQ